ncbi:MAG: DNA-binding response regulator [Oceanospirillaceae bacterium]|nr:DNA-binding response regulator [Oceanospirillaceae bacterium]
MNASPDIHTTTVASAEPTIHAVVVDDHPLFRRGLVQLLKETPGFRVLADFDNAHDYIAQLDQYDAELLLLDLQMPDISGLEALKQIRAKGGSMRIVMVTASDDSEHLIEALSAGADGYLLKDTAPDEMTSQLRKAMQGEVALNSVAVNILARGLRNGQFNGQNTLQSNEQSNESRHETATEKNTIPADYADTNELTQREQQTLQLISQGMSNKLIARELGISDGTVKVYVKNMLRKLNLHSRLELAAWAYNHGATGTVQDTAEKTERD